MIARASCDTLWRKRLNALSSVWPEFLDGQTKGLHKARVATRRIREALPIVGATAPPGKVKKLTRKMRDLTRHLGPIRELDVELDMLENELNNERVSRPALAMVRREVAARRQALRHELDKRPPVSDLKKLLKKLQRIAASEERNRKKAKGNKTEKDGAYERAWRGVLAARLLRRGKRLAAAIDDAGPLYVPERIHDVRIATKKLRYALEITCDAGETHAAPLVKILEKHQARLGRLHDLQSLLKHVREAEASPGVGSRLNELSIYADELERECRRLHAEFVEQRDSLLSCVKEVRDDLVPRLTTSGRRQARVSRPRSVIPQTRPATAPSAPSRARARS